MDEIMEKKLEFGMLNSSFLLCLQYAQGLLPRKFAMLLKYNLLVLQEIVKEQVLMISSFNKDQSESQTASSKS